MHTLDLDLLVGQQLMLRTNCNKEKKKLEKFINKKIKRDLMQSNTKRRNKENKKSKHFLNIWQIKETGSNNTNPFAISSEALTIKIQVLNLLFISIHIFKDHEKEYDVPN